MSNPSVLRAEAARFRVAAGRIRELAQPLPDLIGTAARAGGLGRPAATEPAGATTAASRDDALGDAVRTALEYAEALSHHALRLDEAADAEESARHAPGPQPT